MNMDVWNAMRRKWLVTHNGVLIESKWSLCRSRAEVPAEMPAMFRADPAALLPGESATNWAYALSDAQAADPAFDATPAEWRDLPELVAEAILAGKAAVAAGKFDGPGVARLEGRALRFAGVRFHLADRGRPAPHRGPLPPDAEIVDEAELVAHAEKAGRVLGLVERGTLKRVLARPSDPGATPRS